eukprot:CAMPEP_0172480484 /NCGR_PEP_ID=MMETSP1066-20121228/5631_1 /TAXON_ID=671091 /ORGANISM="Coscinodiscus wailesii, Strain CCMP2513" /LENGTH=178 /DNA_ID=CAMNT_0013241827 /DNA_START=59 /DNA_END=595 /DNA_ORIENTATION=-
MARYRSLAFLCIIISAISLTAAEDYDEEVEYNENFEEDLEAEEHALFVKFDTNGDGMLTRDELRDLMVYEYTTGILDDVETPIDAMESILDIKVDMAVMDKDGDGELSISEVKLAMANHLEEIGELDDILDSYDANGDNLVTFEEYFEPFQTDAEFDTMGDDNFDEDMEDDDDLEEEF